MTTFCCNLMTCYCRLSCFTYHANYTCIHRTLHYKYFSAYSRKINLTRILLYIFLRR